MHTLLLRSIHPRIFTCRRYRPFALRSECIRQSVVPCQLLPPRSAPRLCRPATRSNMRTAEHCRPASHSASAAAVQRSFGSCLPVCSLCHLQALLSAPHSHTPAHHVSAQHNSREQADSRQRDTHAPQTVLSPPPPVASAQATAAAPPFTRVVCIRLMHRASPFRRVSCIAHLHSTLC